MCGIAVPAGCHAGVFLFALLFKRFFFFVFARLSADLIQLKVCTDRRRAQRLLHERRDARIDPETDPQPVSQFPLRVIFVDELVALVQQPSAAVHLPPERLMLLQHAFHIAFIQLGILAQGQIRDLFQLVIFLFPFGGSFHRFCFSPLSKRTKLISAA